MQYDIFYSKSYVILFDGACDQTKELKYGTMSDDGNWIIFGSGSYIFVTLVIADVYDVYDYSTTLLAKINYGKEILNRHYYYSFYNCERVYIKGGWKSQNNLALTHKLNSIDFSWLWQFD